MQFVSVFLITGISALLFPYRKNVRGIWESSPYRHVEAPRRYRW